MRGEVFPEFFDHYGFVIGPVADVHFSLGIPFIHNQVGADAVEEPTVVTDDEGDACEFGEGFFEGGQDIRATTNLQGGA